MRSRCLWFAAGAVFGVGFGHQASPVRVSRTEQSSGTRERLQAVSPVNEKVVWASGTGGTYLRTTDGGETWRAAVVPGAGSLEFRDVHGVDADTAYLLSAGPGERSRIYKTTDAGSSWTLQFQNTEAKAFFDCLDFWDAQNGLALSDSVDGAFIVIRTRNGGADWEPIPKASLPPALPGEGAFAASGTCLVTEGSSTAWFGTGAGGRARVFRTADGGASWSVAETPVTQGTSSSGIFSLAFRDEKEGAALGGDLNRSQERTDNVALTRDGGVTWTAGGRPHFPGPVFGAAFVPASPSPLLVAVGPQGADYSPDGGESWVHLDNSAYWAVAFATARAGWAVGPEGRITRFELH